MDLQRTPWPAQAQPKPTAARRFGYRKSISEIGGLDLGVCRKRRKWQYRYRKTGHPNIFGGFRRFYLMIVYLGSYCHALGGWDADSGRLAQLEGLKTLLSGLPWPLSPARVAYG